jgi:hypothetical protein
MTEAEAWLRGVVYSLSKVGRATLDRFSDLVAARNTLAEIQAAKRPACRACGSTATREELVAAGAVNCCPERAMNEVIERDHGIPATETGPAPPCIRCGVEFGACSIGPNQPSGGLGFFSLGAYGTTLFDPMDGSSIAINVCDRCLRLAAAEGRVLFYRPLEEHPLSGAPRMPKPTVWSCDE